MPFQLINFGQLFFIGLYRVFFRLTPRGESRDNTLTCSTPSLPIDECV